ncbi:unnamed protein product [Rhizopus stolonifer]
MFRESTEWLEKNYQTDNGLPGFFRAGKYGLGSKSQAEADYKESIIKCLSSRDEGARDWSIKMIQSNYEVLNTTTSSHYWTNFSLHENIVEGFYQFENTFSETYKSSPSTSSKLVNPHRKTLSYFYYYIELDYTL